MNEENSITPEEVPAQSNKWKIFLAIGIVVYMGLAFLLVRYANLIRLRSTRFFKNGEIHFADADYAKAIEDYDKAIEEDPQDSAIYYRRGISYKRLGKYDSALKDYNRTIILDPKNPWVYNDRGNIFDMKGNYERAIQDYTKAIALYPNFDWPHRNRGSCYRKTDRLDLAIRDDTRAIEINSKYYKAYRDRGICHFCKGDFEKAQEDFSASLDISANQDLTRAWLYLARERSGKDGKEALAKCGSEWHVIRMFLGEITPEKCISIEDEKSKARSGTSDPAMDFYAGEVYFLQGNEEKAAEHFKRFIDTGQISHFEYMMAKYELERIEKNQTAEATDGGRTPGGKSR